AYNLLENGYFAGAHRVPMKRRSPTGLVDKQPAFRHLSRRKQPRPDRRDDEDERQPDHHGARPPGDPVPDAPVHVRSHEVLAVDEETHEDEDEREEEPVEDLREEEDREKRHAGNQDDPGAK